MVLMEGEVTTEFEKRVWGIELSASTVQLVLVELADGKATVIDAPKRFELADHEDSAQLRSVRDVLYTHFREAPAEFVAIRQRMQRGRYQASACSFKLEAVIQLFDASEVALVPSKQIDSFAVENEWPDQCPNGHKYHTRAFHTALACLMESNHDFDVQVDEGA